MTPFWLAGIAATSVAGSVHCLAMCGPLVGLHGGTRSMRLALSHALGRLATYVALGAVAGAVGSALDVAGDLGGVQRVAAVMSAVVIVAIGVAGAVRGRSASQDRAAGAGGRKRGAFGSALVHLRTRRPAKRAWILGAMTGLIPCGWLWAFVVTAGGTGGAVTGALVMLAFWLGTVPAMVGLLGFAGPVFARLRARMPVVTASVMIALGLGTLAMRWHDAGRAQVVAPHCPHCHGAAS